MVGRIRKVGQAWKGGLGMPVDSIRDVNRHKHHERLNLARKSMFGCSLTNNLNNDLEIRKIFTKLQEIVAKQKKSWRFHGQNVCHSLEDAET